MNESLINNNDPVRPVGRKQRSFVKHASSKEHTANYDYVIIFPLEGQSLQQSACCKFVLKEIQDSGLEVFCYHSIQKDELIALIRCPTEKLQRFADDINYCLELDPDYLKNALEAGVKGVDAQGKEVYKIKPAFITHDESITPFRPWDHIYGKYDQDFDPALYYTREEGTPFTKSIRLKLIYYMLKAPKRQGGCDLKLSKMIHKKDIICMFPLHDRVIANQIVENICKYEVMPWSLNFYDFKEYFGEKIALYNVFIGHYSRWLIYPSGIGLAFQLVVWAQNNFSSPVLPFYSLVITVWSIYMLEFWKREEQVTALRWGMTDFEQHEPDRPEFKGELIASYVNGDEMLYYPSTDIRRKIIMSRTVVISFIMLVMGVVASIYVLRFSLQSSIGTYASIIASVLNTIQIQIFNMIYQEIAVFLTNRENHRTDTQYEDSMIVKSFVFQFINSYASFFFLAFIAQNLEKPSDAPDDYVGQCGYQNCMQPLSINLAIIFGTRLTLTNFLDIFIPYMNYKKKIKKETEGVENADDRLTPAEKDFMLMTYDPLIEGIKNYADTAIQYGFSLLFITALPCANFFSLVSNYVKVKANVWKLATFYQRPIPSGAQDIGTWQTIFTCISVAAVITNAGLVCFTMDVLDAYTWYGRLWIFIGFQWVLIAIQFIAQVATPDVPPEVQIQIDRSQFINEKIIDRVEDEDASEYTGKNPLLKIPSEIETATTACFCWSLLFGTGVTKKERYVQKFGDCPEITVNNYPYAAAAGGRNNYSTNNDNPLHD